MTLRARFYRPDGSGPLRGQLVIRGRYPFGPGWRPSDGLRLRENQPFFLDELDHVWAQDPTLAQAILSDYIGRGSNAIAVGPIVAIGYGSGGVSDYPETNWVTQPDVFLRYLEWLAPKVPHIVLFAWPDCAPYFTGDALDWPALERDFYPVYQSPTVQRVVTRVVTQWEQYFPLEGMREMFRRTADLFPTQRRGWHNSPNHLGPGPGSADELTCWQNAAPFLHDLYLQAAPPSSGINKDGRTPKAQLLYDLRDMVRRFQGVAQPGGEPSDAPPWGPILGADGQPLSVLWWEGTAYDIYRGADEAVAADWAAAALTVPHVTETGDGIPA